ncbi:hypothetical protein HYDPIDRAFT_79146 [Hydnomerulius pinastri MD-312]|nr:hypothetical protein HYDPIDRAFT_79146 [Hydnomerulius pinastri MD-312]
MRKHPLAHALLSVLLLFCLSAPPVRSSIVALGPGPGDLYTAGGPCSFTWTVDPTGTWHNVTIWLMSGSNNDMSLVEPLTKGVDGTTTSSYNYTCPDVTPNSDIYFYQVRGHSSPLFWCFELQIASPSGAITPPEYSNQPDGHHIPWGTGHVAGSSPSARQQNGATSNSTHTHVAKHKTRQEGPKSHKTVTQDTGAATRTIIEGKRDPGMASGQATSVPLSVGAAPEPDAFLPKIDSQEALASPRLNGKATSRGIRRSADPSIYIMCALTALWFLV